MIKDQRFMMIGIAVAALALLVLVKKKGAAAAVGVGLGTAAVDLAGGVVAGAAETIGDAFGVPRTNMTECERAKAEGRTWDASFLCPASDFLGYANPVKWGGDILAGAAETIGDAVGVPRTSMTECEKAIAEGRTLDASFACPASDFLSYVNPFK